MPNEKNACSTRLSQVLSAELGENRLDPIKHFLASSTNFPGAVLVIATGAFRITTSPFLSSRSPITKCAAQARSSARFDCVTIMRRPYMSRFPRSSRIVRKPDRPIARPIVPRRRGVTRLSTITAPILAFPARISEFRKPEAERSGSAGHNVAVPVGEFFTSTPALAVSIPCLTVSRKPRTPPHIDSACSRTI